MTVKNGLIQKCKETDLQVRIMTIHIIIQENETCPATKPEKKYNNRNEREFPA